MFNSYGVVSADKITSYEPQAPRPPLERLSDEKEAICELVKDRLSDGQWHLILSIPELVDMCWRDRNTILDAICAAIDGKHTCIMQPEITPDRPPEIPKEKKLPRKKKYTRSEYEAERMKKIEARRMEVFNLLKEGRKRKEIVSIMQRTHDAYFEEQFDYDRRTLRRQGLI